MRRCNALSVFRSCLAVLALAVAATAFAQSYPAKTVRFVLGIGAGTSTDATARLVAQQLGKMWGQSVVVFNKPGAGGNIAAADVARAAPDGYTFLMANISISIAPSFFKHLPFSPLKDLVPITELTSMPRIVCVNPSLPVHSVKQLIALAKAKPNSIPFGSLGFGESGYLATELFARTVGIKLRSIPYRNPHRLLTALIRGDVKMDFHGLKPTIPFIKAGKLRCLAVTTAHRSPAVPQLPTLEESGVPGYNVSLWTGLFAPAGTPKPIIDKVSRDVAKVLKMPVIQHRLEPFGLTLIGSSPARFNRFFRTEVRRWARVLRQTGIRSGG